MHFNAIIKSNIRTLDATAYFAHTDFTRNLWANASIEKVIMKTKDGSK